MVAEREGRQADGGGGMSGMGGMGVWTCDRRFASCRKTKTRFGGVLLGRRWRTRGAGRVRSSYASKCFRLGKRRATDGTMRPWFPGIHSTNGRLRK
jgi:hypothetical protein